MDALLMKDDKVVGIETHTGETFLGPVILATGHSARDVYRRLAADGVEMEAKGIAVGVRLEHPSQLIDQIQYHSRNGRGRYLPAAEYSFVTQVEGRGVYSFCMCPGGFVVPAASGPEQIVVNGMSPANRGSQWSNSGMVVELRPEDLADPALRVEAEAAEGVADSHPSLSMMHFQERLEYLCWQQGNRRQTAPAQRMDDFCRRKLSARPASQFVRTRFGGFALALLDAVFHCRSPGRRFPSLRPSGPRLPDQRGGDDRRGDPYVGAGAYPARPGDPASYPSARPFPLWRRGGLCWRYRLCGH